MKLVKILNLLFFLLICSLAQETFTIQIGRDAVIILDETEFRITGINSAELQTKIIIQINNADGKEYSEYYYSEDNYRRLESIEAVIKDLNGDIIRELDEDDIHRSTITKTISDGIYYWFSLYSPKYPYIFECTLEYEYNTLFIWPHWQPESNIPILESRYRIIKESPVSFRTYSIGLDIQPEITITGSDSIFTWQMNNIEAKEKKYRTPPENKVEKKILFVSNHFEIDNISGSTQTWDEYAAWKRKLYLGKYNLSLQAIEEVRKITASAKNNQEKIQLIYSFLQKNTRYVAIELGLGGWQPYSADWVYTKKYGDCKDLSICMIAMLDAVDIKAYPALMKTRDAGIVYTDFPSNQFNHALVFVPLIQDTFWLETTSDFLKAGELPSSREGCNVLVIKESESEILRTPLSKSEDNFENSLIEGVITSWNGLKFNSKLSYTGNDKSRIYQLYQSNEKRKIEKYIQNNLGRFESIPELQEYHFQDSTDKISLSISGEFKNFINQTKKRIFLNPNILNRVDFSEDLKDEEREFPVYYSYPFIMSDTVVITIPHAIDIESAPQSVDIDNSFARYKITYEFSDKKLTYVRHFEIKNRLIPVESYQSYVDFMLIVEKYDRKKFVFLKF